MNEEQKNEMKNLFNVFDVDGNGTISTKGKFIIFF
jgi:Ca2+-binding EF-hand superfamily protein